MASSPFDLTGTAAIIAGASRGIGYAIARHFLIQGANVLITGHELAETENAKKSLASEFPEAQIEAIAGDISDEAHASEIVTMAMGAFGHFEAVVSNAGIDIIKPALDYAPEEWDRVIAVNLRGRFLSLKLPPEVGWLLSSGEVQSQSLPQLPGLSVSRR
ncbi:MAG: SDR family NAD(P)-dependent oxidoreductase [Bosea sp.]|nr:SDR family NAD(P)-dependent oxidoreductase [Bosea sp. (in: a-proteobacteria)]MBN9451637.1 SDR family NAD(P)-dependent oxidoreductase [Bosea sp. (in: a-proteobacteria)]